MYIYHIYIQWPLYCGPTFLRPAPRKKCASQKVRLPLKAREVKLVEVKLGLQSFCLDAAQPDTVGGKAWALTGK